jgi:hypothetical protein
MTVEISIRREWKGKYLHRPILPTVRDSPLRPQTLGKFCGRIRGRNTCYAAARTSGYGGAQAYCLKTFVTTAGVRKQWSHSTVQR